MSATGLPTCREENFEATAAWDGRRLTLFLRGSAELAVDEALGPFLLRSHDEAVRLRVDEVAVDMGKLKFMNSLCFKHMVTWLNTASANQEVRYRIRFLSNPRFRWQKASLAALSCFAPELVKVEQIADGQPQGAL